MYSLSTAVNQPTTFYFNGTTGQAGQVTLSFLKDGVLVNVGSVTVIETGAAGTYAATFTPSATGHYVVVYDGSLIVSIDVVLRTLFSYLQNLEDEALGSWVWDKQANTLRMLRQDGTDLALFNTEETLTIASRERV